jgi:hypothetical protein
VLLLDEVVEIELNTVVVVADPEIEPEIVSVVAVAVVDAELKRVVVEIELKMVAVDVVRVVDAELNRVVVVAVDTELEGGIILEVPKVKDEVLVELRFELELDPRVLEELRLVVLLLRVDFEMLDTDDTLVELELNFKVLLDEREIEELWVGLEEMTDVEMLRKELVASVDPGFEEILDERVRKEAELTDLEDRIVFEVLDKELLVWVELDLELVLELRAEEELGMVDRLKETTFEDEDEDEVEDIRLLVLEVIGRLDDDDFTVVLD